MYMSTGSGASRESIFLLTSLLGRNERWEECLWLCRELKVKEEALTCHALVLKVDPTEDGRLHVRGQRVPPFVFKPHGGFSPRWAVATIWGSHKIHAFRRKAAATLTLLPSHRHNSSGLPDRVGRSATELTLTMYLINNVFN